MAFHSLTLDVQCQSACRTSIMGKFLFAKIWHLEKCYLLLILVKEKQIGIIYPSEQVT